MADGALGRGRGTCVHLRGGFCTTHRAKGRKYFRPVNTTVKGADGEVVRKTVKKTYYSCDLGGRGRGRLSQTTLSFGRTTQQGAAGLTNNEVLLSDTSTEGQTAGPMNSNIVDEN